MSARKTSLILEYGVGMLCRLCGDAPFDHRQKTRPHDLQHTCGRCERVLRWEIGRSPWWRRVWWWLKGVR